MFGPKNADQPTSEVKRKQGALLQQLRKENNLDQTELGRLTGVSQQLISKIERGTSGYSPTVFKLAKFFQIAPEELFLGELGSSLNAGSEKKVSMDISYTSKESCRSISALLGAAKLTKENQDYSEYTIPLSAIRQDANLNFILRQSFKNSIAPLRNHLDVLDDAKANIWCEQVDNKDYIFSVNFVPGSLVITKSATAIGEFLDENECRKLRDLSDKMPAVLSIYNVFHKTLDWENIEKNRSRYTQSELDSLMLYRLRSKNNSHLSASIRQAILQAAPEFSAAVVERSKSLYNEYGEMTPEEQSFLKEAVEHSLTMQGQIFNPSDYL